MKCSLLEASDLTNDLCSKWEAFCRASEIYRSPFYWPQFTIAVAAARSDTRIAVYEDGDDVVGILPFHRTARGAGKPVGGQLNDYQGPILAPGRQIDAQSLLSGARITSYDFNHLPASFGTLTGAATSRAASPQMDLSEGYDTLIERKGKILRKARSDIARCARKTERDIGPLRFAFRSKVEDDYRSHLAFKEKLLDRIGAQVPIKSTWLGEVLETLRRTREHDFEGIFATLHAGDRLIAAHFGLRAADTLHWWFPSYDLAARNLGPGMNLIDHCARYANANGVALIDFGKGTGGYKQKFADTHVELCEGTIARPGSAARLIRQGTQAIVSAAERLPLGQYKTYPRRAAARLVSGVALPDRKHT